MRGGKWVRRRGLAAASAASILVASCSAATAPSTGAATSALPSTHTPTPVPGVVLPGNVLFDKTTAGDIHAIYLLTAGTEKQLTKPGAYVFSRISPNHRRMLVGSSEAIPPPMRSGTLDIDGTRFSWLKATDPTLNLLASCWSPDGSRIAFLGFDDSDPSRTGVYTARASDGGDLVRVTNRPGQLVDVPLDFSPDGRWLLFYRSAHPDPDPHVGGSLWTVRVDGTNARPINGTAHPADWARWSPDGQKILFATERTAPSGALWTVSPDGSNLVRLFVDPGGGFPVSPTWSPDGSQILFALDPTNDEFQHVDNTFVVISADGAHLQRVLGTTGFNRWPEWWK